MPFPSATVQSSADHHVTSSVADCAYGSSRTIQSYMRWAEYICRDLNLVVPEREHLESTVRLALRAQELYFAAALHHPSESQLDHFFRQFITLSAVPTPPSAKQLSW
jgi:hypothetical protein